MGILDFVNGILNLDYNAAKKQVDALYGIAEDCESLIKKSKKLRSTIPSVWEGKAAEAAIEKLLEWENEMTKIKNDLENCNTKIEKKIKSIEQADQGGGNR